MHFFNRDLHSFKENYTNEGYIDESGSFEIIFDIVEKDFVCTCFDPYDFNDDLDIDLY